MEITVPEVPTTTTPTAPEVPAAPAAAAPTDADLLAQATAALTKVMEPDADSAPPPPAAPEAPATTPAAEPPPAVDQDEKFARLFARVSGMEEQRRRESAELETLRARVAKADEIETLLTNAQQDPEALFSAIKWTPQVISAYMTAIARGEDPKAAAKAATVPAVVDTKLTALEAKLQQYEAALAQERQHREAAEANAKFPSLISGENAAKYPHTAAFFKEEPGDFAEALAGTIREARKLGRELTPEDALRSIEHFHATYYKRATRLSAPPAGVPGTQSASKPSPSPTTITNSTKPTTSAAVAADPNETDEQRMARAMAAVRDLMKAS